MRFKGLFLFFWILTSYAYADIDFTNFHSPAQVDNELNNLVSTYPGLAKIVTVGTSVEGRPIQAIKISDNVIINDPNEGDVVFVAAHHSNEWISVEMAIYLAEYLLKNYMTNASLHADMDNLEIWIIPIVNPDGVAYTWNPSGYRYWRKNRKYNGDYTYGVDLNRNWGYQYGLDNGSSPTTSAYTYRGPFAFSEPETIAVRNLLQGVDNLKAVITYHSFSELFLRPWGYTKIGDIGDEPPGETTLKSISDRSISLMANVHGHTYSDSIWYRASGETTDWLWGEMRVAAFTPELRPTCCGLGDFSPPPSTIIPSNEENLPAAIAIIHDAGSRELWIRDYASDTGHEPSAVWTGSGWSHAFWESPDIWTVPATLDQGATVDLKVRIYNDTGVDQTNVQVDVYWTDPRISLEFPNLDSQLIGTRTITVPSDGITITIPWTVPVGTNIWGERHWCVGAVLKHANDMPLTTQAQRSSNIAVRNFQTTEIVAGTTILVAATNFLDVASELVVTFDEKEIPRGWKIFIPPQPKPKYGVRLPAIERKARLLEAKGILLEPGETRLIPIRVEPPRDVKPGTIMDIKVHGALIPLIAGERQAVGNGYTYRVVTK